MIWAKVASIVKPPQKLVGRLLLYIFLTVVLDETPSLSTFILLFFVNEYLLHGFLGGMIGIVNEGSYTLMLFRLSEEEDGKLDTSTHLKYFHHLVDATYHQ